MSVSCNGCTECCKHDVIVLTPKDNLLLYRWHFEWFAGKERPVLDRKEDASCIYLTNTGCSIYGRAPLVCRGFDCRKLFRDTPEDVREKRMSENPQMIKVYKAGELRLHTLKD